MTDINISAGVQAKLDRLFDVVEQVRNASAVTEAKRSLAKKLETASVVLSDDAEALSEASGDDVEAIYALSTKLSTYANLIGPKAANTLWKDEDIQKDIKALKAMAEVGFLTDDQSTVLEGIASDMAKGSSVRGPRGEAKTIDGKPVRVWLMTEGQDEPLSNLSGNTAQSVGNIANRLASLLNEDKTGERYKVLKEYARQSCNGDVVPVKGTPLTLVPMSEDENGELVPFTK